MTIRNVADLNNAIKNVIEAASKIDFKSQDLSGLRLLKMIKFEQCGFDPQNPTRALNLIEQVNQTFTALVSFKAIMWLWERYPNACFNLNLGTAAGFDIESYGNDASPIRAEVFATVDWRNNNKLKKDIARLFEMDDAATYNKYVFFAQPTDPALQAQIINQFDDSVTVIYFTLNEIMSLANNAGK